MKPPRFTVARLMILVAVAALAMVEARLTAFFLIGAGFLVALRSLHADPGGSRRRRWAVAYVATLVCLYLPFAWVVWDYPWDDYRWHWIKLWPILPGLIAGMLVHPNDSLMMSIAGLATILLVGLFTALGTSGRRALIAANAVALIAAGLESSLAYALFRF